jgi:hypothetical protein
MSMYSVINEASALRKMKLRMNALYMVEPATSTPKWLPPTTEVAIAAIGDISPLTRQFQEVLNGNSDNFSQCPAPWDDDYLAKHGTESEEKGQTYDDWQALETVETLEVASSSPPPKTKTKTSPYKVKRHSVKELRKEYQVLNAKHHPSPQQLWKREQIARAKKERQDVMLLEQQGLATVETWTCHVCSETNLPADIFACPECGSAPTQPLQSPEEKSDDHVLRMESLATLSKCNCMCVCELCVCELHVCNLETDQDPISTNTY